MILLDTNALIWLEQGHVRTKALAARGARLYISPASVLELQLLQEAGRIRFKRAGAIEVGRRGDLWMLDDPPAAAWFEEALSFGWTRDPFDRLIVAHARLRGWRLATGDRALLDRLPTESLISV